jgi:LPS-assembly protein
MSLSSDRILYDTKNRIVVADGDVVVKQLQANSKIRELHTDRIEYNQRSGIIKLSGRVEVHEPTGEIISAKDITLDESLKKSVIKALVIILSDNSKVKAETGRKNQDTYTLYSANYTPCIDTPCSFPLWDLTAERVTYDSTKETLTYRNVVLRMKGIPILFSPYLKHASFWIKRQTGFLAPIVKSNNDTGFFMGIPYYIVISRDKDFKITPFINSKNRGFVSGEYRQSFQNGDFVTSSSVLTKSKFNRSHESEKKTRWHVDSAFTSHNLDNKRISIRINRASDVTYKLKYPVDGSQRAFSMLKRKYNESKLSFEFFEDDRFIKTDSYLFQTPNKETAATILPHVSVNSISHDVLGGEIEFNSDTIYLTRNKRYPPNFNKNFLRSTNELNWKHNVQMGQMIFDFAAGTRTDIYKNDRDKNSSKSDDRIFQLINAQASAFAPFTKRMAGCTSIFGPKISISSLKPFTKRDHFIQNEDSVFQDVNDLNFYSINRVGIYDRVEERDRLDIGFENSSYNYKRRWLNLFIGRTMRIGPNCKESGKDTLVGRAVIRPNDIVAVRTRFVGIPFSRASKLLESGVMATLGRVSTGVCYIHHSMDNDLRRMTVSQLNLSASASITKFWKLTASKILDFKRKSSARNLLHGIFANYEDECFGIGFGINKSNFKDRDIKPQTGFIFTIMFKNLGNFSKSSNAIFHRSELMNVE